MQIKKFLYIVLPVISARFFYLLTAVLIDTQRLYFPTIYIYINFIIQAIVFYYVSGSILALLISSKKLQPFFLRIGFSLLFQPVTFLGCLIFFLVCNAFSIIPIINIIFSLISFFVCPAFSISPNATFYSELEITFEYIYNSLYFGIFFIFVYFFLKVIHWLMAFWTVSLRHLPKI